MLSRNKKLLFPRLSIKSCNSYLVKMSVNLKLTLHRFSGREQLETWRVKMPIVWLTSGPIILRGIIGKVWTAVDDMDICNLEIKIIYID